MQQILDLGVDINARDKEGRNAISLTRDDEMCDFLLSKGAMPDNFYHLGAKFLRVDFLEKGKESKHDVNAQDVDGNTAAHIACMHRVDKIWLDTLLQCGATPSLFVVNKRGESVLHCLLTHLTEIVSEQDTEVVKRVCHSIVGDASKREEAKKIAASKIQDSAFYKGFTVLHFVAKYGFFIKGELTKSPVFDAVLMLCITLGISVDLENSQDRTPFHETLASDQFTQNPTGRAYILKKLMEAGSTADRVECKDLNSNQFDIETIGAIREHQRRQAHASIRGCMSMLFKMTAPIPFIVEYYGTPEFSEVPSNKKWP